MKRLIATALLIALYVMAAWPPMPAYAIVDPDTPPSVNAVYTYEGCYEDGDLGVLIDYYLDYAVLPTIADPDDTATNAYMFVFIDTDGTTQLKAVSPYAYQDSGYGRGLAWIYFSATEVTAYGLSSANVALYNIWLVGNPTIASGWAGDPPKTIANIDQWNTTGTMATLIALRVLYYADQLELIWSLDLIEATAIGSRLTTLGVSYFTNAIANLRTIAPDVFSSATSDPTYTAISYDTAFGATATSGTANVTGSPVTLASGSNVITTGATTGTMLLTLAGWTAGTVTNGTGTVTGSPVTIRPGVNTLTVTGAGTFTVAVAVVDTVTLMDATVTGTAMDLTDVATAFGMSRWMFSGLVWMLITIIICAAAYVTSKEQDSFNVTPGNGKVIMYIFTLCVIAGTLLGLLNPLIYSLLFICCGAMIGIVLFFQSETLHKGFMFMAWMWIIVCLAGNVAAGSSTIVATRLTADLATGMVNSISVASTTGFPESGTIVIGDERIDYPDTSALSFDRQSVLGVTTNPIVRGVDGTTDASHLSGAMVRTVEASILNASLDYKIARIADSAGLLDFITLPFKLLDLVMTFFVLPLDFLGTDLAILTYIWMVVAAGMIVGFVTAVVGGRRV